MNRLMIDRAITLHRQADAVALAAANLRGHIDNLVNLVAKGQRPQHELDHQTNQYPALAAAAETLASMKEHEAEIRALMEAKRAKEKAMTENIIKSFNPDPFDRDPVDMLISSTIQDIYKILDTHTPALTDDQFGEVLREIAKALQYGGRNPVLRAEVRQLLRHVRGLSSASC
jgi:hypothetical protein